MSYQNSNTVPNTFEVIDYNNLDRGETQVTFAPQSISSSDSSMHSNPGSTETNFYQSGANSGYTSVGEGNSEFISQNNIGSSFNELTSDSLYTTDLSETPTMVNIHLFVGVISSLVTFLVWHYLNNSQKGSLWWWMYVPFVFAMTLTAHVHYYTGNYFKGVVIIAILLHVLLFIVDAQSNGGSPKWVMWPAGITAMILIAYHQLKYISERDGWFNLALYEFCIMNVLFFLAWLTHFSEKSFPWWIIPFFVLSIPVSIAHLKYNRNETRGWVWISVTLVLLSLMTFFIWGFVESYWPWFLIEWGVAGGIIFFLWYTKRRQDDHYVTVTDEQTFTPGSFANYNVPSNNMNAFQQPKPYNSYSSY